MMASDPDVRMRYLSFGLFAQQLIDVLIEFVDEGRDERLPSALTEAIEYLKAASGGADTGATGRNVHTFRNYEQVRTLDQVCPLGPGRKEIIQILEDLRDRQGTRRAQRRKANRAIEFFYALENRALRNFAQPEPLPRGIRELCQV